MPNNMRGTRGEKVLTFLKETYPKTYSKNELAAIHKIPEISMYRILTEILVPTGGVKEDATRRPNHYQYVPGAKINIWPPFEYRDEPEKEVSLKPLFDRLLELSTEYKTPPLQLPAAIIYATIYCMEISDPDERVRYLEWLDATAAKLKQYYIAYRLIKSVQALPIQNRRIEKFGIENKLPGQDNEDQMSMTILFQHELDKLLKQIP